MSWRGEERSEEDLLEERGGTLTLTADWDLQEGRRAHEGSVVPRSELMAK